jgi:hypothetical protein
MQSHPSTQNANLIKTILCEFAKETEKEKNPLRIVSIESGEEDG